mgnify:CR=1 FL=1
MTIWKVEIEELTFDRGLFTGYKELGYWKDENKAKDYADKYYNSRCKITEGKIKITPIKVN